MRDTMAQELTLTALRISVINRRPGPGLLHHADRGSQYAAHDYRRLLTKSGILCSMSRKGDCRDDAPTESFFGSLKTELEEDGPSRLRRPHDPPTSPSSKASTIDSAPTRRSVTKRQLKWNNPPRPRRP